MFLLSGMEPLLYYQSWFPLEREFDRSVASRAEKREELRGRNNVTSCRSPPRECTRVIKTELRKKRQQEFQKRRSFSPERATSSSIALGSDSKMEESRPNRVTSKWESMWFDQELELSTSHRVTQTLTTTSDQSVSNTNGADESGNKTMGRMSRDSSVQTDQGFISIQETHVQQLAEYLKEALWREEAVKQKLVRLQKSTSNLLQSSADVWTTHCSEHLLRNRINALEGQLQASVQKFPKDGVKQLVLQMEKQKLLYEQRATAAMQKATQDKMEALSRAESLQEALSSSQAESLRWQGLYKEQKVDWAQLRKEQTLGDQQLQQLQGQMQVCRSTEAELREEVGSLGEKGEELQLQVRLLEENNQVLEEEVRLMRENMKLQETLLEQVQGLEGEASVKETRRSQLEEQLLHTLEKLRQKEQEVEELQAELRVLERECQSSQSRVTQCREELRQLRNQRRSPSLCGTYWKVCVLLVLLVLAAGVTLWLWHPPFREQVEDLYWDIQARVEDYLMQTASRQCFRPM